MIRSLAISIATICGLAIYAVVTTHTAAGSCHERGEPPNVRGHIDHRGLGPRETFYKRRISRLVKRIKRLDSQPVAFAMTEEQAREQIIRKEQAQFEPLQFDPSATYAGVCPDVLSPSERDSFQQIYSRSWKPTLQVQLSEEPELIHQGLQAVVGRDRYLQILRECSHKQSSFEESEDFDSLVQLELLNLSTEQVARMSALKQEYSDVLDTQYADDNSTPDGISSYQLDPTGHFPTPEPIPAPDPSSAVEEAQFTARMREAAAKFDSLLTPQQREKVRKYSQRMMMNSGNGSSLPIPYDVLILWQGDPRM
jgi:hypothetical protein